MLESVDVLLISREYETNSFDFKLETRHDRYLLNWTHHFQPSQQNTIWSVQGASQQSTVILLYHRIQDHNISHYSILSIMYGFRKIASGFVALRLPVFRTSADACCAIRSTAGVGGCQFTTRAARTRHRQTPVTGCGIGCCWRGRGSEGSRLPHTRQRGPAHQRQGHHRPLWSLPLCCVAEQAGHQAKPFACARGGGSRSNRAANRRCHSSAGGEPRQLACSFA